MEKNNFPILDLRLDWWYVKSLGKLHFPSILMQYILILRQIQGTVKAHVKCGLSLSAHITYFFTVCLELWIIKIHRLYVDMIRKIDCYIYLRWNHEDREDFFWNLAFLLISHNKYHTVGCNTIHTYFPSLYSSHTPDIGYHLCVY